MSTRFQMLVDADVSVEDAKSVADRVLRRLQELGLIVGEPNRECALGGEGYPPGPEVEKLYEPEPSECPFWTFAMNGVEVEVGPNFNIYAYGPACESSRCPRCDAQFEPEDARLPERIAEAIGQWVRQTGPAMVECPECASVMSVLEWDWKPPLGFGSLSFTFWEWPPLDAPGWRIDLPSLVADVTGHRIIHTYGRI